MKRFKKPACIFIAALLFISTEHCNASVLKHLDEDYKREVELKTPAISGGKVVSRYSRLYFCFCFSFPMSFILVVNFKRLNFNKPFRQILMTYMLFAVLGRSVLGKTVPEVLSTARGRKPRAVLKTKGTVFPNTNRPRTANNVFIFFFGTALKATFVFNFLLKKFSSNLAYARAFTENKKRLFVADSRYRNP